MTLRPLVRAAVSLLVVLAPLHAQGAADAADPPTALRDEPRFDEILSYTATPARDALAFWVGEWDCYGAASRALNGHNRLEARLDGKAILEQWRPAAGTGGARGESWNWFDGTSGHWRQTWIDANGAVVEFVGRRQGAGILFEAEVDAGGGGATQLRRMFVRPVDAPPGLEGERRVRQTGTLSNDGGATWQPNYDLVYVPKGRSLDGSAVGEARTDPMRR